jgi:Tfp pilus assembly protein PilF
MELEPGSAIYSHNRGYCHRNKGRFAAAVEDYTRAIASNPSNPTAFNNRGFAWR